MSPICSKAIGRRGSGQPQKLRFPRFSRPRSFVHSEHQPKECAGSRKEKERKETKKNKKKGKERRLVRYRAERARAKGKGEGCHSHAPTLNEHSPSAFPLQAGGSADKGKRKGDGKAARTPSPKRDGVCYAWREAKCTKGDQCKYKHAEPANPKASAPAPNAKQQAKAQAKPNAIVRKAHVAMPAITVKRAATSEAKKNDKGAEESEAEVESVHHDRDAEDAASESSRWSGETDTPEKYVWFQEIL